MRPLIISTMLAVAVCCATIATAQQVVDLRRDDLREPALVEPLPPVAAYPAVATSYLATSPWAAHSIDTNLAPPPLSVSTSGANDFARTPMSLAARPSYASDVNSQSGGGVFDGSYTDPSTCRLPADCDACPSMTSIVFVDYASFRGVPDDSWQHNGINSGANFGTRLGQFSDWTGIGFQIGGSVGVYDWSGTDYRPRTTDGQVQGFLTYGFFRRPDDRSKITGAIVNDWMFNDNYGDFSQNPTLSQWRGQLGYAFNWRNELGVWGAWRGMADTRNIPGVGLTEWRAVNQMAGYWHYKWAPCGADTWLMIGAPEQTRLAGGGSLGAWLASLMANIPLSDRFSIYTLVTYMSPSSSPGPTGSEEEAWNFTVGMALYPGRLARSSTVAGRCWIPVMPVANNGTFYVDTNNH